MATTNGAISLVGSSTAAANVQTDRKTTYVVPRETASSSQGRSTRLEKAEYPKAKTDKAAKRRRSLAVTVWWTAASAVTDSATTSTARTRAMTRGRAVHNSHRRADGGHTRFIRSRPVARRSSLG